MNRQNIDAQTKNPRLSEGLTYRGDRIMFEVPATNVAITPDVLRGVKNNVCSSRLDARSHGAEARPHVRKVLFRALVTQLHPGRKWNPGRDVRGGKTSAGDLSSRWCSRPRGKGSEFDRKELQWPMI